MGRERARQVATNLTQRGGARDGEKEGEKERERKREGENKGRDRESNPNMCAKHKHTGTYLLDT